MERLSGYSADARRASRRRIASGRQTRGMKCPTDDALLVMSDRNGIEIDYCPQCRGVWLDRGELDKIIDRASTVASTSSAAPRVDLPRDSGPVGQPAGGFPPGGFAQPGHQQGGYPQRWGSNSPGSAPRYGGGYGSSSGSYRRPKNWLSELFD